jgi:hypothetical protein
MPVIDVAPFMHDALTERLAELETQQDTAPATDFPAGS